MHDERQNTDVAQQAASLRRHLCYAESLPVVIVTVARQVLSLELAGKIVAEYPVSTAANGVGGRDGSGRTPPGLHRIAAKIGADAPGGTVFKGRRPTGEVVSISNVSSPAPSQDLITSRILWLAGLEPGVNQGEGCDSYARYIYIHGTADELRLGQPVSHGCVRMANADVMACFDAVEVGTPVFITTALQQAS